MNTKYLFAFFLALWTIGTSHAETSVAPGVNAAYADPDVGRWRGMFERPGREIYDRRDAIVAALRLAPGMAVADVGAGTGLFAALIAEAVGTTGRVYAVDIVPEFVASITERTRAAGLDNVVGVVNTARDASLPAGRIDLVFLADTYHHFEYPRSMMDSLRTALGPGGEVVVIDFIRKEGVSSPWVLGHVRAGAAIVRDEIESAGFALVESLDLMETQYFMRFRKIN